MPPPPFHEPPLRVRKVLPHCSSVAPVALSRREAGEQWRTVSLQDKAVSTHVPRLSPRAPQDPFSAALVSPLLGGRPALLLTESDIPSCCSAFPLFLKVSKEHTLPWARTGSLGVCPSPQQGCQNGRAARRPRLQQPGPASPRGEPPSCSRPLNPKEGSRAAVGNAVRGTLSGQSCRDI